MKKICALALLLAGLQLAQAQPGTADSLASRLAARSGIDYVEHALLVSEAYFSEGKFAQAEAVAQKALDKANTLNLRALAAISLNRQGRAMVAAPNASNRVFNRAFKAFEESNEKTLDDALRLDNTQRMLEVAGKLNKRKDMERLQRELDVLQGKQKIRQTEEELTELTEEQQKLQSKQAALIGILQNKEAAIAQMSDAQLRQQYLLSEQERIVDSMTFSSIVDSFALAQSEMLVQQHESDLREREAELDLQRSQRNFLLALAGAILLLAIGLFHRYHVISRHNAVLAEKNKIIEAERKRNEELLLNILPKAIADELKLNGVAETQHYEQATVLFADFVGFSRISKQLSPEKLVADLDYAFKHFDAIIGRNGLEKIKTIGDAYMCAGGLPSKNITHPSMVVKAALEMQEFLHTWNLEKSGKDEPAFEARIGIHTGPLIAGVVGSKKFAYDIWGDTVNVASRMESSSEAGRVNISEATYGFVKNDFDCEYRGKVPAKNVGEVEMYYVNAPKA